MIDLVKGFYNHSVEVGGHLEPCIPSIYSPDGLSFTTLKGSSQNLLIKGSPWNPLQRFIDPVLIFNCNNSFISRGTRFYLVLCCLFGRPLDCV